MEGTGRVIAPVLRGWAVLLARLWRRTVGCCRRRTLGVAKLVYIGTIKTSDAVGVLPVLSPQKGVAIYSSFPGRPFFPKLGDWFHEKAPLRGLEREAYFDWVLPGLR